MKKVVLTILLIIQVFGNSLVYSFVRQSRFYNGSKDVIGVFFGVIRSVVDFSVVKSYIKNNCIDDEQERIPEASNHKDGVYLVITLNNISSLSLIFLQGILVFLGFINIIRARGRGLGGRWYIFMFLFILVLCMYKYVYYAPRSSISDCVISFLCGVLISSHCGGGMKLRSHRNKFRVRGSEFRVKLNSFLKEFRVESSEFIFLTTNNYHQLSTIYYQLSTINYRLSTKSSRFNSASWFFTPYHPLVPSLHGAGLSLLVGCGC